MPEKWILQQYQALPLRAKVMMSKTRIEAWYEHYEGNVCVSFSGGKDSTVLAHLVHSIYPQVPLVFANTGLEYPEIQAFAKKMGAEFVRPKMNFSDVISKYGYPILSKENAEAIYYARRIKNAGGDNAERTMVGETGRRRSDISGRRKEWELIKTEGGDLETDRKRNDLSSKQREYGLYTGQVPRTSIRPERMEAPGKPGGGYNRTKAN